MLNQFSRTALMIGEDNLEKLKNSGVIVFGVGGVGGYVVEALARSGVGRIDVVDDDKICITNINRQILATTKTVGQYKVDIAEQRILDINPEVIVTKHRTFYTPETADNFDFSKYDYVVDAIDTVVGKLEMVVRANQTSTPIISCMGAGNKMDATRFEVADIYKTSVCPVCKILRKELKKRNIKDLKVVYSKEIPQKPDIDKEKTLGSVSFVPSVAGLIIAGEVVKDIIKL